MKRVNPYTRLLGQIKEFCANVGYLDQITMWNYHLDKVGKTWTLDDLYQRAAAANQLGYDVHIRAEGKRLTVVYVKELPQIPYEWRY